MTLTPLEKELLISFVLLVASVFVIIGFQSMFRKQVQRTIDVNDLF